MSRITFSVPLLALVMLAGCDAKKGYAESLGPKLPLNPAGAGAVQAEGTRCTAMVRMSDLVIKCSPVFLKGMVGEANEKIKTLLVAECATIEKAGFGEIHVDWGTAGSLKSKTVSLKDHDGKVDCTLEGTVNELE